MNSGLILFCANLFRAGSKVFAIYLLEKTFDSNILASLLYSFVIIDILGLAIELGHGTVVLNSKNYHLDQLYRVQWTVFGLAFVIIGFVCNWFLNSSIILFAAIVAMSTVYWSSLLEEGKYKKLFLLSVVYLLSRAFILLSAYEVVYYVYFFPDLLVSIILLVNMFRRKVPFKRVIDFSKSRRLIETSVYLMSLSVLIILVRRADILVLKQLITDKVFVEYMLLMTVIGYIPLLTNTIYNRLLFKSQVEDMEDFIPSKLKLFSGVLIVAIFTTLVYSITFWKGDLQWIIASFIASIGVGLSGVAQIYKVIIHKNLNEKYLVYLFACLLILSPIILYIFALLDNIIYVMIGFLITRLLSLIGHKKIASFS